jgi:hypothetical protein
MNLSCEPSANETVIQEITLLCSVDAGLFNSFSDDLLITYVIEQRFSTCGPRTTSGPQADLN